MIHSSLVFVLKWLPDHLVLAASIEATWFFISKTIFNFLIAHTIFDVKECIFKIRCHQSAAHSTLQWCKGQVYILRSDQLEFCLICDIIWTLLLHLFEFEEVYLIISFGSDLVRELHGPLVHWSIGPPAQAGLEVIPHWVAGNSNPMPHKTYLSLENMKQTSFWGSIIQRISSYSV